MTGGPPLDTSVANQARVYDCWLGGKDNYAADREVAEAMAAIHPGTPAAARDNRLFIAAAVSRAAMAGVAQFLDLGAGLPAPPPFRPVHEAARRILPAARVAYVDHDPVVASHIRSLQAGDGIAAVAADITDPGAVLADPGLREVIDLGKPAAVILAAVAHFMPSAQAREVIAAYRDAVAPGSWLAVSVAHYDDLDVLRRLATVYRPAGEFHNHSEADLACWLDGMDLVEPGITTARRWARWPVRGVDQGEAGGTRVLCGAGIKP